MPSRYIPPALRHQPQDENQDPNIQKAEKPGEDGELPTRKLEDLATEQNESPGPKISQNDGTSTLLTHKLEDLKIEQNENQDPDPSNASETPTLPTPKSENQEAKEGPKSSKKSSRSFASRDIRYYNKSGKNVYDGKGHIKRDGLYGLHEIHTHFAGQDYNEASRSTLNNSSERLNELVYVMLFPDANPRWNFNQIIFAKTNIEFLPGYEDAYADTHETESEVHDGSEATESESKDLASFEAFVAEVQKKARGSEAHKKDAPEKEGMEEILEEKDPEKGAPGEENLEKDAQIVEALAEQAHEGDVLQDLAQNGEASTEKAQKGDVPQDLAQASEAPAEKAQDNAHDPSTKPGEEAQNTSSSTSPTFVSTNAIAIFEQTGQRRLNLFRFLGWYKLAHLAFLQPKSPELVRMLAQKWNIRDKWGKLRDVKREKTAWKRSMAMRWAVLKMWPMKEQPATPAIDKLAEDGVSIKRKAKQDGSIPGWEKLQDFEKWEKPKPMEQKYGGEEIKPKELKKEGTDSIESLGEAQVVPVGLAPAEEK